MISFYAAGNFLIYNYMQESGQQNITLYDIFCEEQIGAPLIIPPGKTNGDSTVTESGIIHHLQTNGNLTFCGTFPQQSVKTTIQVYKIKPKGQVPLESLTTIELPSLGDKI